MQRVSPLIIDFLSWQVQSIDHWTGKDFWVFSSFKVLSFYWLLSLFVKEGTDVILSIFPLSVVSRYIHVIYFLISLTLIRITAWKYLLHITFFHFFLLTPFHSSKKQRSITAHMNQFYFLAACEDIFTFGLSLITCKSSWPYNLSKIFACCFRLGLGKIIFFSCHPDCLEPSQQQPLHWYKFPFFWFIKTNQKSAAPCMLPASVTVRRVKPVW